ncbi:MAG: hypothetical protein KME50_12100 [Nostoc desertorum CM1-VF14]|jgi:hypothetical protein|nr:hypothetical protein [Nostoc desertorum CM1-VF14]
MVKAIIPECWFRNRDRSNCIIATIGDNDANLAKFNLSDRQISIQEDKSQC